MVKYKVIMAIWQFWAAFDLKPLTKNAKNARKNALNLEKSWSGTRVVWLMSCKLIELLDGVKVNVRIEQVQQHANEDNPFDKNLVKI